MAFPSASPSLSVTSPTTDQKISASDCFRPTWGRVALAVIFSVIGFFLPQEVPLEYYPLNNPSSGLQYLEITCAASVEGMTELFLDTGKGFNELDKIRIPMGVSQTAYTYTFPLSDAPLCNLRLDPFIRGAGELKITNFRIINRRGEEIRRIAPTDLHPLLQITIVPLADGWKIVTPSTADDPQTQIQLGQPLVPEGMNERNLKRCLLSSGYLCLMLWILLLAVYFTFWERHPLRSVLRDIAFLALLSLMFSLVGNRGLIKNSIRYAQYASPVAVK